MSILHEVHEIAKSWLCTNGASVFQMQDHPIALRNCAAGDTCDMRCELRLHHIECQRTSEGDI